MDDYGCDPMGDGTFKMIPSGKIVSAEEKNRILQKKVFSTNDCFGLSWEELAIKQGGLSTLDIVKRRKNEN